MNQFVGIVSIVMFVSGCTTASNKIANRAMEEGTRHVDNVVADLEQFGIQKLVDFYARMARDAAASGDANAAAAAVTGAVSDMDLVTSLSRRQYLLARSLVGIGRMYVWENRGILDVLMSPSDASDLVPAADDDETASE